MGGGVTRPTKALTKTVMAQTATQKFPHGASTTTFTYTTQSAIASYTAPTSLAQIGSLGQSKVSMIVDMDSVAGSPSGYTLDVKLQYSIDGTNWTDLGSGNITQITTVTQQEVTQLSIASYLMIRPMVKLTLTGGTTPTATFTVTVSTTPTS